MLNKIVEEVKKLFIQTIREVMESDEGINRKVGRNTLKDSDLYLDIEGNTTGNSLEIYMREYIYYIEWDRPPNYGKMPPVDVIADWLKRKHIVSTNENIRSVAFVISRAIQRDGWKARKILEKSEERFDDKWDRQIADDIFETIFKEFEEAF